MGSIPTFGTIWLIRSPLNIQRTLFLCHDVCRSWCGVCRGDENTICTWRYRSKFLAWIQELPDGWDEMRFCDENGNILPDSPFVICLPETREQHLIMQAAFDACASSLPRQMLHNEVAVKFCEIACAQVAFLQ